MWDTAGWGRCGAESPSAIGRMGSHRNPVSCLWACPLSDSETWPLLRRLRPSDPPVIFCYKVGISLHSDLGRPLCSTELFQITLRAGCLQSFLCPHCQSHRSRCEFIAPEVDVTVVTNSPWPPSAQCFKNKDFIPSLLANKHPPQSQTHLTSHHRKVNVQPPKGFNTLPFIPPEPGIGSGD